MATPFRLTPDCRIAVDLDGVLTEHPRPLSRAACDRFGLDLPERAFVDSAGLNVPEAVREWVYGSDGPATKLSIAPGAVAFLERVVEITGQHNVVIITARPRSSTEPTVNWLRKHGLPAVEIFFADDKVGVAQALGCQCAVEDSVRHAKAYAAAGMTCYLVNAETNGMVLPAGIMPARNLEHLADLLTAAETPASLHGYVAGAPQSSDQALARPRIVISDAIHPDARATLAAEADLIDVDGTDLPALLAVLGNADALVVRSETQVTRDVLKAGPRLRVIARAGVGVDTIDLAAATEAGVLVLNAPGANATSAGEHTISLLLALTRQIPFANETTHAGQWQRKHVRPIDLRGRVAGIVGLGRVGSVVARRLRAFEMELIGYDPHVGPERFRELGVTPVDYPTLLSRSDVVTYHVPSTPETFHMLDAVAIERLKPSAIVLNCARGDVVDQDALAAAVRDERIAGAGVDVFPSEPTTTSPLFGLPNVVLTPHTGGSSAEALAAVGQVISTTTLAALRGEAVPNAVNMPGASLEAPALRRLTTVACAAGKLLAVLEPKVPSHFQLVVHGQAPKDVAEHVLGAALSEALRRWADRRVTPVNAKLVAGELGMTVRTISGDVDPNRMPAFTLEAGAVNPHRVTLNWDLTSAGIVEVDRFSLERALAGDVLITHHVDQPGVIGHLGTILGRHNVNIAGMQVGRHQRGGEAIMVTNVDDEIPPEALEEILEVPGLTTAYVVSLPPAEPRQARMPDLVTVGD
ncbi:MAG TPA: phosphoglycerate dehydrogenase [Thermomicrobiales bacterium]|nr:phosphoglycerate dehydrogenase [Thermomicrobiales bacterium]